MKDKELKELFLSKKNEVEECFKKRITYENWDKKTPVYFYNILDGSIKEFTHENLILNLLFPLNKGIHVAFPNRKLAETYKWTIDTIEKEVDERINSGFKEYVDQNFVDFKDLNLGVKNVFFVEEM